MEFDSGFQFNWEEGFSLDSQPVQRSISESLSSAPSAYAPLTSAPRRNISKKFRVDLDNTNVPFWTDYDKASIHAEQTLEIIPSSLSKAKPENLTLSKGVSATHGENNNDVAAPNYNNIHARNLKSGPVSDFAMPAAPFLTRTISLAALELAPLDATPLSWSSRICSDKNVIPCVPQAALGYLERVAQDMATHSQLTQDSCQLLDLPPDQVRVHERMVRPKTPRKHKELKQAQYSTPRKSLSSESVGFVDTARRATWKCDYPSCCKAFRRTEHLKRHKQTSHGQGRNRFSCEFCGKNQFNRQDNLNSHRKRHARLNSRGGGVAFIPAAVPIIEQEQKHRKRKVTFQPPTDGCVMVCSHGVHTPCII